MSTDSKVTLNIAFAGEINGVEVFKDGDNPTSPAIINLITLAIGDNTITVPNVSGTFTNSITIIPPLGNTVQITLKGAAPDTGIPISKTDITKIAFETAPASFILNAAVSP